MAKAREGLGAILDLALFLVWGMLAGLVLAAELAWRLMAGLASILRRASKLGDGQYQDLDLDTAEACDLMQDLLLGQLILLMLGTAAVMALVRDLMRDLMLGMASVTVLVRMMLRILMLSFRQGSNKDTSSDLDTSRVLLTIWPEALSEFKEDLLLDQLERNDDMATPQSNRPRWNDWIERYDAIQVTCQRWITQQVAHLREGLPR